MRAHSAALGPREPAVCRSLWHTSRLSWRALCCSALQLWYHSRTSAAAAAHSSLLCWDFFEGALHLVQRRKRYLAIWMFVGVCCESEQINCERRALRERCVVWPKYSRWRFCLSFSFLGNCCIFSILINDSIKGHSIPQPVTKMMAVLATVTSLTLVKSDFTWYCSVILKECVVFRMTVDEH